MKTKKTRFKGAIIVLSSTVLSLLIVEVLLRVFMPSKDFFSVWKPNFSTTMNVSGDVMPGIKGLSTFSINEQGVRGDVLENQSGLRILAIGGSTTECFYLDDKEAWPYLIQQGLKANGKDAWVGNIGRSGLSCEHHVLTLERGIKQYEGINVAIFLVGINDVIRDINHSKGHFLDKRPILEQAFMQVPKKESGSTFGDWKIYELVSGVFESAEKAPKSTHQDQAGIIYDKWRVNRQQRLGTIDSVPLLTKERALFEKRISGLISLCKEKNIVPIFVAQPSMYQEKMPENLEKLLWLGGLGDFQGEERVMYYSTGVMKTLVDHYNALVKNACKKSGALFIELNLEKNTSTFYDDCHFNAEGSANVAKQLTTFITEKVD